MRAVSIKRIVAVLHMTPSERGHGAARCPGRQIVVR